MLGIFAPPALNPEQRTDRAFLIGSEVAARLYVEHAVRSASAGEIALFVPAENRDETLHAVQRLLANSPGSAARTHIFATKELPEVLRARPFTAFHNPLAPQLHQLSYMRSQFA